MRDLIIEAPEMKTLTLTRAVTVAPGITIPAGTILTGRLEYLNAAEDNDPTPLNKASLLPDEVAMALGMDLDTATVGRAFLAVLNRAVPSTFQRIMTGRLI